MLGRGLGHFPVYICSHLQVHMFIPHNASISCRAGKHAVQHRLVTSILAKIDMLPGMYILAQLPSCTGFLQCSPLKMCPHIRSIYVMT